MDQNDQFIRLDQLIMDVVRAKYETRPDGVAFVDIMPDVLNEGGKAGRDGQQIFDRLQALRAEQMVLVTQPASLGLIRYKPADLEATAASLGLTELIEEVSEMIEEGP